MPVNGAHASSTTDFLPKLTWKTISKVDHLWPAIYIKISFPKNKQFLKVFQFILFPLFTGQLSTQGGSLETYSAFLIIFHFNALPKVPYFVFFFWTTTFINIIKFFICISIISALTKFHCFGVNCIDSTKNWTWINNHK